MQILSKDSMEMERHCIFEFVQFLISKFGRVAGIIAQTIVVKEGAEGFRCGLARPEI